MSDDFVDAPLPAQQATEEDLADALAADHTGDHLLPAPEWTALNPFLAFEAGKADIELERGVAVELHLVEQKVVYERFLAAGKGDLLVQALLDRDRVIAQMGREIANGKTGGRLLREFVRAALASAERLQDPQRLQDFLEEALGAETADRRQLRLKGTTL